MSEARFDFLQRYGAAFLAVVVATFIRWLLQSYLGERVPFVTYFVAVVFAAWYGGVGPSLAATALASLAAATLFIAPRGSPWIHDASGWVGLATFVFVGMASALLSGTMRSAQQLARAEHEHLSITLTSIGDAVIATDVAGRVTFLNPIAEKLTGWTTGEARGMAVEDVFQIIDETSRRPGENPVVKALREGRAVGLANHTLLISKSGSEIPIDDSASPIRDARGRVAGVILVFRDVAERRRSERRLQISEARKTAILNTALDAIITMDHEGRVVEFNPAAERVFGYQRDQVLGKEMAELIIPPALREQHRGGLKHFLLTGEGPVLNRHIELTAWRADGTEFPVELAITHVSTEEKPLFTGYLRDISGRRRQEAALSERVTLAAFGRDVGLALTHHETLPGMLQNCAQAMVSHLDGAFARIWTVNEAENVLELQASAGIYTHLDGPHCRVPVGQYKIGMIAEQRQPHLTNAVVGDPRVHNQEWAREQGMVAFAGYPLLVEDRVVGVMAMFARHTLSEATLEAMASVANGIAVGIERKRTEARLREEQERLRTTLASIGDAVITTDTVGRVTNMNAVAEAMTGWTAAQARGEPLESVFHIVNEDSRQVVENPATRALRDGVIVGLANHTVLIAQDGSERPIDDSAAPIRCKDGEIVGCVLVFRDVTERRRAERAMRYQLNLTKSITDNATTAIFMMDNQSRCTFMNPAAEAMTGFRFAEADGRILHDLIHHTRPDGSHYPMPECPLDRALPEKFEVHNHEDLFIRKNGEFFPVLCNARPVLKDGEPAGTVIEVLDLTQQRVLAEQLRQSEARFTQLADAIPQLAWMAEPDGSIDWFNDRWYEYTGTSFGEVQGWKWQSVLDPQASAEVDRRWRKSLTTGQPFDMVLSLRGADSQFRPFLTRVMPFQDERGEIVRWFGTNTDISEQKQIQEELREVAARLSEADRRKDEFLATLAHELRNPLAPIRSGLEVLKLVKNDGLKVDEIRELMERQTQQLIMLVDDLLDVSRITRGKLELRKCWVKLADVVQSALEASQPVIAEAQHSLAVEIPPHPIFLDADPHRLAQVLSNLLNNAAKYTPDGGRIELRVERQGSDVVIKVKDSGIGIPREMQKQIFEMFAQIDRPMEKSCTGLGIGLTLVKSLVEMHGGSVEVDSEGVGCGSEFRVRLPIQVEMTGHVKQDQESDVTVSGAMKRRVLVVDDNKAAAEMLGMIVKMLGNEVRTAGDGQHAIEVAMEFQPDVVLMDLGMPRMNGYEAARHLRELPWGGNMLLVALTGWGQDEDKRRTKEAGFDYHLVKPAEPAELQQLLVRASGNGK